MVEKWVSGRPDEARQLTGLGATDDRELNPSPLACRKLAIPCLVVIG